MQLEEIMVIIGGKKLNIRVERISLSVEMLSPFTEYSIPFYELSLVIEAFLFM